MVTDKIKELAEIEAKAAELKISIEQERMVELAALPEKYGYSSMKELIAALKSVGGDKKKKKTIKKKAAPKVRRKRAKITPEIKDGIVKALNEKKSASAIAAEFKVSVASVNLIKKAAGLTKARK
jgi:hypothetical protein